MDRATAQTVVLAVWNGEREIDQVFSEALRLMGIEEKKFQEWRNAARNTEGHFPRRFVLTPTSAGKRR